MTRKKALGFCLRSKLTDMVSACKGVAEHRGKLWGELSEGEGNIVAARVGAIAHEIVSSPVK
jgi:hypothetical protein